MNADHPRAGTRPIGENPDQRWGMHLTEYGTLGQQAHALTKPVGAGLAAAGGIALAAWLRKRSA